MEEKSFTALFAGLVARCWEDAAFKREFIAAPAEKLAEAGIPVEEGVVYRVIEAPRCARYVVLPHADTRAAVEEVFKLFQRRLDEGEQIIPEQCEVRFVQNTQDTHYLVLPQPPQV